MSHVCQNGIENIRTTHFISNIEKKSNNSNNPTKSFLNVYLECKRVRRAINQFNFQTFFKRLKQGIFTFDIKILCVIQSK